VKTKPRYMKTLYCSHTCTYRLQLLQHY